MGRAFAGLANDPYSGYFNPAGYALQQKRSVGVMHEPRGIGGGTEDMFLDYLAFAYPAGKIGSFGATVFYNDIGKTPITDEQGNVLGTMHSYHITPSVYYAYPLKDYLGVGAGFSYAYEHNTDQAGGTLSKPLFHAGVLYETPIKTLRAGLAFNNIGTSDTFSRTVNGVETEFSAPPPRNVRLGLSFQPLASDMNDIIVVVDGYKLLMNFDDSLSKELSSGVYAGGLEYVFAKMVAVRAGYYYDYTGPVTGLALGFGFAYKGISFDYARVPEGVAFKDRHRFGIGYTF